MSIRRHLPQPFHLVRPCLILLLLTVLLVRCTSVRRPESPVPPSVRVLTYNVNVGGPQPDLTTDAIRGARADIICLQETSPEWEAYLREHLAADYPYIAFRHSGGAGGQGILSRYPLTQVAYVPSTPGWFPGWILRADTPLGPVQLLSVHLHPPLGENGSVSVSAYFSTSSIREKEIQALHSYVQPRVPTMVLGDFNEQDSGSAVQWLRAQGYTDALREFDTQTNTWHWPTSVITLRARYDHILYSPGLHCFEAKVIPEGASDHYPVLAIMGASATNTADRDGARSSW